MPRAAYLTLPPDRVCEVVSPSTEQRDRTAKLKLSIYARSEVRYAWLVNSHQRLLETHRLGPEG